MAKLKRLRKIAEDNNSQTSEDDAAHFSRFNSLQAAAKPTSSHMESSQSEFSQTQPQVQESAETEYIDAVEIIDSQGKKRKKSIMHAKNVWSLPDGERVVIVCNLLGQPVKKSGGILGGWLGIIARRPNLCPIHYPSWKVMPLMFKTKLLLLTRSKFLLPSNGNIEKWVLKSLSRKWKDFKCELKGKYMIDNYTEQEVASNVPSGFTSQQWIDLVRYWFSEKSKSYSQIGKVARAKHITPHTTGSMSFARKRDLFDGTYDGSSQEVLDNITKLIEKEAKTENEAFTEVIGKDRYGRVKGYGIGVTPTQLFGVHAQIKNMENGGVDPSEDMRKLQAQIQDMQSNYDSKLLEMQQNYEQKLQGMQKTYESQLEDMKQLLVQIASKLQ
uniref:Transposase, Ptta/En/Spm, plant n=1 Tax=Ananas comosus var. bracteatus TaxID=296719 RepID=A0A6V7NXA1_ANACO|nr:unnamed protein product [Ananas comosus var. bracteatus]